MSDLTDGTYTIFSEDDAGNKSIVAPQQTFYIDRTLPNLPKLDLGNTDTGILGNDLITKIDKPIITFNSELGLRTFIENLSTSTVLTQKIDDGSGDYVVNFNANGLYDISFENELTDGNYRIYVQDDAGNENELGYGNHTFNIDTTSPEFKS